MKQNLLALFLLCSVCFSMQAQDKPPKSYRNFPLVLSMQFHSLSLPFKDFKTNFSNVGFGVGSEISLGSSHAWSQQFNFLYYRNKNSGDGVGLYTQSAWRPSIAGHMYAETKIGVGVLYSFRPVESFKEENGTWTSVGHRGKWMPVVPMGISIGYNKFSNNTYVSPFISYQLMVMAGYNKVLLAVPNTLIQIGSRIHFKN